MGWSGYGMYDGDGTQSRHYDFIKWSKIPTDEYEVDEWMNYKRTKIPKNRIKLFESNLDKVLSKMPKLENRWHQIDEDNAIDWQMLAELLISNGLKVPEKVYDMAKKGTEFLMGEHSSEFNKPGLRRATLRRFLKRLEKNVKESV